MSLEYRIVCSGHVPAHVHHKPTLDKAASSALQLDAEYGEGGRLHQPGTLYSVCVPWRVERRTVGDWETVT